MKLTGKACQCTVCNVVFSTDANFRRHRTGDYGNPAKPRKCLTPESIRLVRNANGRWGEPMDAVSRLAVMAKHASKSEKNT